MIAHTVSRLDLLPTCERLSFPLGAAMDVSGKVRKLVMREAQMKLVIEPDDVSGFVVFADCLPDAENLRKRKDLERFGCCGARKVADVRRVGDLFE